MCVIEFCGDGIVNNNGAEGCDDGQNGDDTDGCNDSCQVSTNGVCGIVDGSGIYDANGDGNELTGASPNLCGSGDV